MTTGHLLAVAWDWEPSVVAGCAALLGGYAAAVRLRVDARSVAWAAGVLALCSPLDALGDRYLFSAHMAQHLILMLVVPPLLLAGLRPGAVAIPIVRRAARVLGHPLIAWVAAVAAMFVWHLPVSYDAALGTPWIHVLQHLVFLATSTMFWWPVLAPVEEARLALPAAVLYLLTACVASSILGIVITLAPAGLYAAYADPADPLSALPLIRDGWGLSPRVDQTVGGLLMWVAACVVYLSVIISLLVEWFGAPEARTDGV